MRVAFFTSTRAEYGLLKPIMKEASARICVDVQLIVSGTHLSKAHGDTLSEILEDGFSVDAYVDMSPILDDALSVSRSGAKVLSGVADALVKLKPDVLLLLGDRYELLAAAQAALLCGVPIAHIHGGEITEGAIDDAIRHSITKLAHWHFAAAESYAERIQQMGESPERVWNVGAPAMDNIFSLDAVPKSEIEDYLGVSLKSPSFLVTYHPVTVDRKGGVAAMNALIAALDSTKGTVIITGVNADPGAGDIRNTLNNFAAHNSNTVKLVESLGSRRYLSLMRYVDVVLGNSSSGLLEAPAIGVPTVDIGARQRGRLRAPSVIHCEGEYSEIVAAIEKALSKEHRAVASMCQSPYGQAGVSRKIVDTLTSVDLKNTFKRFVDRPIMPKN
ncbi:UDP-N-acetylglucosamine 2-epimerase [Limnobacter sp. CACIAM 66H1]|uniref:UDP-N-acetylglucosamine 2-epimerase n=1 Tax=Limnobacter sp. CACIAM 66H1 TaxID=1813033 RepID=UPI000B174FC7|nr:UDP-N-acetylglucosamine 2-epimerase [Limnobacter sp. CACIAM 66H1]